MSIVRNKSMDFALRIVNLSRFLIETKKERILSTQILRSGTSIGANINESVFSESDADYIHKLNISRKEAKETLYWLELIHRSNYISKEEFTSMRDDCGEILRIVSVMIEKAKVCKE